MRYLLTDPRLVMRARIRYRERNRVDTAQGTVRRVIDHARALLPGTATQLYGRPTCERIPAQ